MKKLALLLAMFMPIYLLAQTTFVQMWSEYLTDCNELVNDTITQTGIVKCKLVPVKMNEEIVSYSQLPTDTVWNKCNCKDYKYADYLSYDRLLLSSSGSDIASPGYILCDSNNDIREYIVRSSEKVDVEYKITREKVCVIKKRKASMDDFLNRWLEEKGYIKTN